MMIVCFFNIFLGLFFYTENALFQREYNRNIFVSFPQKAMYVSEPFQDEKDVSGFMQVMDESNLSHHVGYSCSYLNVDIEPIEKYVYLNEYMLMFEHPLEKGTWLKEDDEIILGGPLSSKYAIGDSYYMGTKYIGKIVGILGEEYSFMFLNVSGEKLSYENIFSKTDENIVITCNKRLRDELNMEISMSAITLDEKGHRKLETMGYNLNKCEDISQMHNDEYQMRETRLNRLMIIMLICSIVMASFYLLHIYISKNIGEFRIMWEQLYSDLELAISLSIPLIIDILMACMSAIFYALKFLRSDVLNENLYGVLPWIIIFSIICIFVLTVKSVKGEKCKIVKNS